AGVGATWEIASRPTTQDNGQTGRSHWADRGRPASVAAASKTQNRSGRKRAASRYTNRNATTTTVSQVMGSHLKPSHTRPGRRTSPPSSPTQEGTFLATRRTGPWTRSR